MFFQLRARKAAGRDRNRARANRLAARNIVWRVPDHIDLGGGKIDLVLLPRALLREAPEFVAIVMIVGKGAELEKIPEPVMRELQLRAAFDVTGEKTENILRSRSQPKQQFLHAWKDRSIALGKLAREKLHIEIEEGRGRLVIHSDVLFLQNLVNDSGVGPARDLDAAQVIGDAKLLSEDVLERLDPGTAGID